MVVLGSACEAASCTSRSGTPASRAAVMNAWRNVCGPIGLVISARRATRRTTRLAPVTIKTPTVRRDEDRTAVTFADGQIDRPGSTRCQRDGDGLTSLAHDGEGPMASLEAQGLDVGPDRFGDPQTVERQQ